MSCELCNDLGYIVTGATYTSPYGEQEQCPLCGCREHINVLNISGKKLEADNKRLAVENEELKDLAIWMTGCGYEFTQHQYFCEQRDKLLKGGSDES